MNKRLSVFLAIFAFTAVLLTNLTYAQKGLPKATKFSNVQWYGVLYVKYKPGKVSDALKIVDEHFVKARETAGLKQISLFRFWSGYWDLEIFFPWEEGPSTLEWQIHPDSEEFNATLAKQEGSSEKSQQLIQKYLEMIADSKNEIALRKRRNDEGISHLK